MSHTTRRAAPRVGIEPATIRASAADLARFVVGQDLDGHWVAIEIHGRAGGLFRSRQDAVDYAEDETDHRPDGVLMSGACVTLSL